ncbi:MAG: protein kinase domain-containing protein [Blastocatellia bacterium]
MTPERYQQIKQIYLEAADRDPAERAAWLAEACGADQALRAEIEALLNEYAETAPFLETPPPLPDFPLLLKRQSADELIGQRIGPYKILREIGQGGMGAVYLAERADREFKQRVALKIIKRGMDTDEIIARFRHERQILAALDHPNIARLLDGGTTADGLPYFVMEHVEGEPLDGYCASHNLSLRERLELFRTVCGAVHYAHQNLVVHRDLKPANILVTAEGAPKLLDFGIAKVLNPALMSDTLMPTATSARPMTPAYASPEQVRGQAITTASDVYALGIILYETLTGQRPYEIKGKELAEVVQVVCESAPSRPSTAFIRTGTAKDKTDSTHDSAETARWRKQLAGDLDNIVLMALRKEPQRRYASVEQFSEDLRRHLAGLPVIAREDTFRYRAGKFVRRNRLAVAAASIIAVLLSGFLVTTLVQAQRIARERDRAQLERDKAEKVSAFLVDLFKVSDPGEAKGNAVTARELLDKGAQEIGADLKDQPETQAKLMDTIGMAYDGLGLYPQALPLIEQSLATRQRMLGAAHAEVGDSLRNLAQVKFNQGEFEAAAEKSRAALEVLRKAYGNEHLKVAQALSDLGLSLLFKGDAKGAEPYSGEAVAILRKLPNVPAAVQLQTIANYGNVLRQNRKFAEATQAQEEALDLSRRTHGDDDPNTIITLGGLALLLSDTDNPAKNYARAEKCSREALERGRRILPAEHPQTIFNLIDLGGILIKQNNLAAAETTLREAYARAQNVLPAEHFRRTHAQHMLGRCYAEQHRYAEAEPLLLASWQTFNRLRGAHDRWTGIAREQLAKLYEAWGKPEKAVPLKQSR